MKESHLFSLLKAISWRIFGSLTTMIITYIITGEVSFAVYVGFFELFIKIGLFYVHERIWSWVPLGKKRAKREENVGQLLNR